MKVVASWKAMYFVFRASESYRYGSVFNACMNACVCVGIDFVNL